MGQLALVLGDFHIPMRAFEIPAKYREMITPNKVNAVFCTGNLGSREAFDWCKSLSPIFHIVRGDYEDETLTEFPEDKVRLRRCRCFSSAE
jgi:vacuolar protein sorting-associated protein 29